MAGADPGPVAFRALDQRPLRPDLPDHPADVAPQVLGRLERSRPCSPGTGRRSRPPPCAAACCSARRMPGISDRGTVGVEAAGVPVGADAVGHLDARPRSSRRSCPPHRSRRRRGARSPPGPARPRCRPAPGCSSRDRAVIVGRRAQGSRAGGSIAEVTSALPPPARPRGPGRSRARWLGLAQAGPASPRRSRPRRTSRSAPASTPTRAGSGRAAAARPRSAARSTCGACCSRRTARSPRTSCGPAPRPTPVTRRAGRWTGWSTSGCPSRRRWPTRFVGWLQAPDGFGNPEAMARRLGITYLIWNNQTWRAYDPGRGWTEYNGCLRRRSRRRSSTTSATAPTCTSASPGTAP